LGFYQIIILYLVQRKKLLLKVLTGITDKNISHSTIIHSEKLT